MLSAELGPSGGYLVEEDHDVDGPIGPRIVLLYADHDTQARLTAWAHAMGFDVGGPNPHEGHAFHITILATENDVAIPLTDHIIEPIEVVPIGVAHLGRDGDVPALTLADNAQLEALRAHFVDTYGAEPTFAEFRPHISLSYDWDGEPDMRDRDILDDPLVFDRLCVKPFEPDGAKGMLFAEGFGNSGPSAHKMPEWLVLLLEFGTAGAVLGGIVVGGWYAAEGLLWLTEELARRVVDFFRGEEAVLLDEIAELDRQLSEAGADLRHLAAERRALYARLEALRGAIDEVEATPTVEQAGLAAVLARLEAKADDEGDLDEAARAATLEALEAIDREMDAIEDILVNSSAESPQELFELEVGTRWRLDHLQRLSGDIDALLAAMPDHYGDVRAEAVALRGHAQYLIDAAEAMIAAIGSALGPSGQSYDDLALAVG